MILRRAFTLLAVVGLALGVAVLTLALAGATRAAALPPAAEAAPAGESPLVSPTLKVYTSTIWYQPFPDNGCPALYTDTIFVTDTQYIQDVNVGLNLFLPDRNDLRVWLVSSAGVRVGLVYAGLGNASNLDVMIDQESPFFPGQPPGNVYHDPAPPYYEYSWKPGFDDLRKLNGLNANGFWRLEICDTMPSVPTNQLNFWSLHLLVGDGLPRLSGSHFTAPFIVPVSQPFTATFTIENSMLFGAASGMLEYPLPTAATYLGGVQCVSGSCAYNAATRAITWFGPVNPYANIPVSWLMRFDQPGVWANTAFVSVPGMLSPFEATKTIDAVKHIYSQTDFETDNGGFTANTPPGEWEYGQPLSGTPPQAHSGYLLWGTDLLGDYDLGVTSTLVVTGSVPVVTATGWLELSWWQWVEIDAASAQATLFANGTPIWSSTSFSFGWQKSMVDVRPYMGQQVIFKWVLTSQPNAATTEPGWYIDDVSINTGAAPNQLPWYKDLWINGVHYLPGPQPFAITPGDSLEIADHVGPFTQPVSFTLVDDWTPGFTLTGYAVSGGFVISSAGTITWTMIDIQPGGAFAITKTFAVNNGAATSEMITETLKIMGTQEMQFIPLNFSVTFPLQADLLLTQLDSPDPALISQTVVYTVNVNNLGPDPAAGVKVIDYLPPGAELLGTQPSGACSQPEPGRVVCFLPALPMGVHSKVEIFVGFDAANPNLGNVALNYAVASSETADPNPSNNATIEHTGLLHATDTRPRIASVTPSSAVNIAPVPIQILGQNFDPAAQVFLGNAELLTATVFSSQTIVAEVPALLPPATYSLKVVNPDGQAAILLSAFTVLSVDPPAIDGVLPARGLTGLPVAVVIFGSNFSPDISAGVLKTTGVTVTLESVHFINAAHLRAVVPLDIPVGVYDLELYHTTAGTTITRTAVYTALDPLETDDLYAHGSVDLWALPPSLQASQPFTLGLNVHRLGGGQVISDVAVNFYNGDPASGGVLIGQRLAEPLAPNGLSPAAIQATAPVTPGLYTLFVVIDPDNLVAESDELNNQTSRSVHVLPPRPALPPEVISFTLNGGEANTFEPQVFISLTASHNPAGVLYIEYVYDRSVNRFVQAANSGWLPFGAASVDYAWGLHPVGGVHYLQAWLASADGLISTAPGLARINYLPAEEDIASHDVRIYRYTLFPGNRLLVRLTSNSGDADLYVWNPDGSEAGSSYSVLPVDEVFFTATVTGTYQIEVEGFTSANYSLEIVPLGGLAQRVQTFVAEQQTWLRRVLDFVAPQRPDQKGRKQPYSTDLPPSNVGLPAAPESVFAIYLPLINK